TLNDLLWQAGTRLVLDALDRLAETGELAVTPQDEEGVTFTHLLKKEDGKIDWRQSAAEIDRQIRGLNPRPGTWCDMPGGKRLKILAAEPVAGRGAPGEILPGGIVACGEGALK